MEKPPRVACMDTRHPRRLLALEQVLMRFSNIYDRPSSSLERQLTVGFSVWHLAFNLLARHLAPSLSYRLLVEALGLFLLLDACRPHFLPIGSVLALEEWLEEVYGDGQDDGGVLLACDLAHRLKQPELQRRRALQTVCGLPEAL